MTKRQTQTVAVVPEWIAFSHNEQSGCDVVELLSQQSRQSSVSVVLLVD